MKKPELTDQLEISELKNKKQKEKYLFNNLRTIELYFETLPQLIQLSYHILSDLDNPLTISMINRIIFGIVISAAAFTFRFEYVFEFYKVDFDLYSQITRIFVNILFLTIRIVCVVGALNFWFKTSLFILTFRFFIYACVSYYFFYFKKIRINLNIFEIIVRISTQNYFGLITYMYMFLENTFFIWLILSYFETETELTSQYRTYFFAFYVAIWMLAVFIDYDINSKKIKSLVPTNTEYQRPSLYLFLVPTNRILFQTADIHPDNSNLASNDLGLRNQYASETNLSPELKANNIQKKSQIKLK